MAHDRGGGSYQTLINAALRDHVEADQGHLERTLRGVIRLSTYLDSVVRRRRRSVIGGMLLRAIEHVQRAGADPRTFFGRIFGEEKNLTDPAGALATFDCVIANPPFSLKEWGREVWDADPWGRAAFGLPPASYGRLRLGPADGGVDGGGRGAHGGGAAAGHAVPQGRRGPHPPGAAGTGSHRGGDRWIKAQIAAGHFTNDSEYIRDLIRRDRERSIGFEALQAAVQEGLDSGPSDKTVPSIMEEVEARLRSQPGTSRRRLRQRAVGRQGAASSSSSPTTAATRRRSSYTNRTLVHLMTQMLQPQPGDRIYDPTAGTGGMLISALAEVQRNRAVRGGAQRPHAIMVERVVNDIDEIVSHVRFAVWQTTRAGEREMLRALRAPAGALVAIDRRRGGASY